MKRCLNKAKDYDQLGQQFQMKLEGRHATLPSYCGFLGTIITVLVVSLYAYLKYDVLKYRKDVNILSTVNKLYFDDKERFDFKNGLNFAVAVTAYDNE